MSDEQACTGPGTPPRRTLLAGAGAVGAGVLLSACGSDEGSGSGATPTSGGPGATGAGDAEGGDRDSAGPLARTTDVPVGGGVILADKGVVITQPQAGQFKGFDPICTHQGCPVSKIDAGSIICTCHGSRFSTSDGSVQQGPATKPLPAKQLKVTGEQITLA
ncbi:Rieske (2Fe-2S) protein [Micromonospora mirobrigensis]|uniref:Cytochrome bc1 complex Rieske iron-sulfur subunit n=1 Tax=Micromonospora mirobrigensis TaxID=262898 RepID=A0A1C5ABD3_9ACTN|nr:Rieske (2Fe-2S) protein [Micromonospora mirobrigensis]SCF42515.1 Ferredoxin subunit of nitrite reductase or a ring-hydroxylating dioxygenase [Micromonospora mirobrigensis]